MDRADHIGSVAADSERHYRLLLGAIEFRAQAGLLEYADHLVAIARRAVTRGMTRLVRYS